MFFTSMRLLLQAVGNPGGAARGAKIHGDYEDVQEGSEEALIIGEYWTGGYWISGTDRSRYS